MCLCYCFVPGRAQTGTLGLAGTPQLGLPKCTKRQFPRGLHLGAFVCCSKWSLSLHRRHHQEVPASIAHSPGPLPAWHPAPTSALALPEDPSLHGVRFQQPGPDPIRHLLCPGLGSPLLPATPHVIYLLPTSAIAAPTSPSPVSAPDTRVSLFL